MMKNKFKLSIGTLIIAFLSLSSCNDKKNYVEKVRESSAEVSEIKNAEQILVVEPIPGLIYSGIIDSSEVPKVPDENLITRGKDGVAIGRPLPPSRPGFVMNPFTNNMVDVRGVPAGTKVRDPSDPNPDHIFRVPNGNK